ncbi:MAG: YkgJ family cysteine cluster protein [Lentisphaeria bacterium]|jgi:Fe-S-cluster containining protein|nr:YkgJ family cysteine cluster protein [Lentisphaeria bacterium]
MPERKVHIAENQNYGCIQCGRCCRRFHVLMSEDEALRLGRLLASRPNDLPKEFVTRIDGKPYFARRPSGACVFLDEDTGYCRMHSLFGFEQKALSCRGYPVNIASSFPGEVSAIARQDCPAVQQNAGRPLTRQRREIEGLVEELDPQRPFTRRVLEGLDRKAVEAMVGLLVEIMRDETPVPPRQRAGTFRDVVVRLEKIKDFANDPVALSEMLPNLLAKARAASGQRAEAGLSGFSRAVFRTWLGACLRRDTELVRPGVVQRVLRMWTMLQLTFGHGSLHRLGWEHPRTTLDQCPIFGAQAEPSDDAAWASYRRWLLSRLEAYQFFGVTFYDEPFFPGLRALALTYPLVLAAARHHSRSRGANRIEEPDVHYGIGAIDHTLGRSPLMQYPPWRIVENHFFTRWDKLLATLGWE